jgi:type VI secretion system protein ImpF
MANGDYRYGIKLSILDRIIGPDPASPRARMRGAGNPTVRDLEETLHRDLTALLNTRRPQETIPEQYTEVVRSLVNYGIPDFTGCSAADRSEQERFRREIENAIRQFEPRLSNVTVSLDRPSAREGQKLDSSLKYHVRALLQIEPEPEPIRFDAVLEPGSGRVDLQGANSR